MDQIQEAYQEAQANPMEKSLNMDEDDDSQDEDLFKRMSLLNKKLIEAD